MLSCHHCYARRQFTLRRHARGKRCNNTTTVAMPMWGGQRTRATPGQHRPGGYMHQSESRQSSHYNVVVRSHQYLITLPTTMAWGLNLAFLAKLISRLSDCLSAAQHSKPHYTTLHNTIPLSLHNLYGPHYTPPLGLSVTLHYTTHPDRTPMRGAFSTVSLSEGPLLHSSPFPILVGRAANSVPSAS